jgi:hypothetical protein
VKTALNMQGFQCIADDLGGWGAPTAELLQGLQDEYAGSPVLLWCARRQSACTANPAIVSGTKHYWFPACWGDEVVSVRCSCGPSADCGCLQDVAHLTAGASCGQITSKQDAIQCH